MTFEKKSIVNEIVHFAEFWSSPKAHSPATTEIVNETQVSNLRNNDLINTIETIIYGTDDTVI